MSRADAFLVPFSTAFALLGLKLLFGDKPVTMGSVVLLACISAAVGSVWTGGASEWVETNVASALNGSAVSGLLRADLVCQFFTVPLLDCDSAAE